MSDDQVKRYQLDYHHTQTYAEMVEDCDGDWVKYNDYKAASDRIEELQAKLSKSEALLAKAVEAAEKAVGHIERIPPRIATARVELCDAIAELSSVSCANLKGQDDE